MKVETTLPLLEELFSHWKETIGPDYEGYKNHVYRMLNFCFYLHNPNEEEQKKLVIAAVFHDIGIWSANTLDYLKPSVAEARLYLEDNGLEDWIEEITLIIDLHHKLTPVKNDLLPLIEVFRRADLIDFSLGAVSQGVSKPFIKEVKQAFPNANFHKMLMKMSWKQLKTQPLNLLPMMKW